MKSKRIACLVLTMMLAAGVIPAQAVELTTPGGTVTTDVTLGTNIFEPEIPDVPDTPEPEIFSVTVPTELPIRMDKDGNVTTGDKLFIRNFSSKDVEVTAVSIEGKNGWSIVDFNDDFLAKEIDTKEIGLSFRGDLAQAGGQVVLTPESWVVKQDDSLDIKASARLGRQTKSEKSDIAAIDWTLSWAETGKEPDDSEKPQDPSTELTVKYENGLMLPGSINTAIYCWDSTDRSVTLDSVVSSAPDVADIAPTVARSMPRGAKIYRGEKTVTIEAKSRGTAIFTGATSTGESVTFSVDVYELDKAQEPVITVKDADRLQAGDTVTADDITVALPVTNPDGSKGSFLIHPDTMSDTKLGEGINLLQLTINANGIPIDATVEITTPSTNPSNGLVMSVSEAQDMGFTFEVYEDGLQITGFENKQFKSTINVPGTIGDFRVLKIGSNVFKGQTNLKAVTLPDTVVVIGDNSFSDCTNLTSVNIPRYATSIGASAFSSCTKLAEVDISENVSSIASSAFLNCEGLTNLVIPRNVTSIGPNAFKNCKALNLTLESIPEVNTNAFSSTQSVSIKGQNEDFYPISSKIASAVAGAVSSGSVVTLITDAKSDVVPRVAANGNYICQNVDLSWSDISARGNYGSDLGDVYYPAYFNGSKIGYRKAPPFLTVVTAREGTRVHFADLYNIGYPEEAWIDRTHPERIKYTDISSEFRTYGAGLLHAYYVCKSTSRETGFRCDLGQNDNVKASNAQVLFHYTDYDEIFGINVTGCSLMSKTAPSGTFSYSNDNLSITAPGATGDWYNKVMFTPECASLAHTNHTTAEGARYSLDNPKSHSGITATWALTLSGYHSSHGAVAVFCIRGDKTVSRPFVAKLGSYGKITVNGETIAFCTKT